MLQRVLIEGVTTGPPYHVVLDDDDETLLVRFRVGAAITYEMLDRMQHYTNVYLPLMEGRPPLTYTEAATVLGVSNKWLQRRIAAGTIPSTTVAGRTRFHPEHVRWIRGAMERGAV